jgi:hypothetical protein
MCTRIKKLNRSAPETTDVDHHAGDRAVDRANDLVPGRLVGGGIRTAGINGRHSPPREGGPLLRSKIDVGVKIEAVGALATHETRVPAP